MARLVVILTILFFYARGTSYGVRKTNLDEKIEFEANRDLGEIKSRLGAFGSLL